MANPISQAVSTFQKYAPSPALAAGGIGLGVYGLGRLAWGPVVDTVRSLARVPGRKMGELTDDEWDDAMDELKRDSKYRRWIPAALGTMAGMGALAAFYRPNERWGGLFSWNAPGRAATGSAENTNLNPPMPAGATYDQPGLDKKESFENDMGYVGGNEIDYGRLVGIRQASGLFTNDPGMDPYAANMGTAIVNNAGIRAGSGKVTLGSIFDSAVDKFDKKLSFAGLAKIGVRTALANANARLFTSALSTMTDLSPEAQRTIIDTGTWAGAIGAIME